jgi:hypothetical protein
MRAGSMDASGRKQKKVRPNLRVKTSRQKSEEGNKPTLSIEEKPAVPEITTETTENEPVEHSEDTKELGTYWINIFTLINYYFNIIY